MKKELTAKTTNHTKENKPTSDEKQQIVHFLYTHLGEYGDPEYQIEKAIDYSLREYTSFGGFVAVMRNEENDIVGAVVVNRTGMDAYIPENILVYIAIHEGYRGKGIGGRLMTHAINTAEGDIALHVEMQNRPIVSGYFAFLFLPISAHRRLCQRYEIWGSDISSRKRTFRNPTLCKRKETQRQKNWYLWGYRIP